MEQRDTGDCYSRFTLLNRHPVCKDFRLVIFMHNLSIPFTKTKLEVTAIH